MSINPLFERRHTMLRRVLSYVATSYPLLFLEKEVAVING